MNSRIVYTVITLLFRQPSLVLSTADIRCLIIYKTINGQRMFIIIIEQCIETYRCRGNACFSVFNKRTYILRTLANIRILAKLLFVMSTPVFPNFFYLRDLCRNFNILRSLLPIFFHNYSNGDIFFIYSNEHAFLHF